MMNSLNSILIEGEAVIPAVLNTTVAVPAAGFCIKSVRYDTVDGERVKHENTFPVRVFGRLAERCAEEVTAGRGLRVVGRIARDGDDGPVVIVAEHVEFRRLAR